MSRANLHLRSRKKKDGFEIPLVEVSSIDVKLLRKKCCAREISRAVLGSGNNPPFLASLHVDICTEAVAIDVPEMVSARSCCKAPPSTCHWKQDVAATRCQINSCIDAARSNVNDVGG